MYCGETSLVNYDHDGRTAVALRCRSWTCPDCAPDRRKKLIAEILGGAPTTFLTLTSRRVEGRTPAHAAAELAHAWRLIRLRCMRQRRLQRLPFFAVFEATQLGWPHLHICLRNVWIDQRWLSEQMRELTNSPIVDIRRIDNKGRAVAYVAKYSGKASHRFATAKRYWSSRDYQLPSAARTAAQQRKTLSWERDTLSLKRLASAYATYGWRVDWRGTRELRATYASPDTS